MQIASRLTLTSLALGIAGVLAMGQADASGFQIRENSVRNMGRANAGTTVAWGDASVVLNNPAAMVNIDSTTLQADITVIDLTADFEGSGTTALGTPISGGDGGDPGDPTPVPALAAVFPLGEGVVVGASVTAPFGLKTDYDPTWVGRYDAITSDVKIVDFTVSAAYAMNDRLSFGVGVIFQNADVTLSKAIDFGTALCAGSGNPANCFNPAFPFHPQGQDGMIEVAGDDTAMGWVAGVQFKASDSVTLGYAHRSEISHDLAGTADFTMPASVAAALAASPAGAGFADSDIHAALDTPSTDTVSMRLDVNEDFRILADAQLTGWSSLQSVDILRDDGSAVGSEAFDWDDTWFYSVGGEWDMSDALVLRAGIGMDESPTKDTTRTPRLPDNDRMVYTFGASWQASERLTLDASYMRVQIDTPTVNTTSSSGSHLVGEFDGYANLFGVSAQYRF